MNITKDTKLEELLVNYPDTMRILAQHGMRSIACPAEFIESLEKVAKAREMPVDKLLEEIREFIASSKTID